jgi:hypothetical protein
MWVIPLLAGELLASQEGLCFLELEEIQETIKGGTQEEAKF